MTNYSIVYHVGRDRVNKEHNACRMNRTKKTWAETRGGNSRAGVIKRPKIVETVEETGSSDNQSSDTGTTSRDSDSETSSIEVLYREESPEGKGKEVSCVKNKAISSKRKYEDLRQRYERRYRIAKLRIAVLQREVGLLKKLVDKDRIKRLKGRRNLLIEVKEKQRTVAEIKGGAGGSM